MVRSRFHIASNGFVHGTRITCGGVEVPVTKAVWEIDANDGMARLTLHALLSSVDVEALPEEVTIIDNYAETE
jgi:hypothetical protein